METPVAIEVGIVGAGFIGTVHSFALRALGKAGLVDARVTQVLDRDRERAESLARHHGADVPAGLSELLDAVDAVWVCTPTGRHLEIVAAAAERGRAVFCEKPLARTHDEAQRVAAALRRVPHQVGLVLRAAPVFARLVAEIRSGRHGRTMVAVFRDDQFFPIQGHYASTWRADAEQAGGGTLLEHSIHDLDLLRWMLGDPVSITARVSGFSGYPGVEEVAAAQLAYHDGRHATLVSVWHQVLSRPSTRRLEVFCEQAVLWTDDDNLGPLHIETSAGEEVVGCPPPAWVERLDLPEAAAKAIGLYAAPSKRFLDALARGEAPRGPGEREALAAHRLVDAAYRSAATGGIPMPA